MFDIGQKVVCIDDSGYRKDAVPFLPCRPRAGGVYTVADIHTEPGVEDYGIRLEECPNPEIAWSDGDECEWSFHANRFRPLGEAEFLTRGGEHESRRQEFSEASPARRW